MNLYLLTRTDEIGYDEYDSVVVAAPSAEVAMTIEPPGVWASPDRVSCKLIGAALVGTKQGVVHSSFRAG